MGKRDTQDRGHTEHNGTQGTQGTQGIQGTRDTRDRGHKRHGGQKGTQGNLVPRALFPPLPAQKMVKRNKGPLVHVLPCAFLHFVYISAQPRITRGCGTIIESGRDFCAVKMNMKIEFYSLNQLSMIVQIVFLGSPSCPYGEKTYKPRSYKL